MKGMDCSKDIVQDLLVNLWHSDIQFASGRELMGYLYKYLYNNSLLYIRNKKKRAMILDKIDQEKENEDFCHFLVQKKRDIENLKKQVEIISIPLVLLAATAYFEVVPWKEKFSIEEAGIAILAIVFGIAVVVARDIQRWRDQTEFLEDIMQVLGDKEQN